MSNERVSRPAGSERDFDPITYQDILLTAGTLAAIYTALAASPLGPWLQGRAGSVARRAIRDLGDDAARIKGYAERLGRLVESHSISAEPLDVNRGRIRLNRADRLDLRDARNNLTRAVQRAFKHADDLAEFFESESFPINDKLKDLSSHLNEIIKSGTYGEATARLIKTADILLEYLEDLRKIFDV